MTIQMPYRAQLCGGQCQPGDLDRYEAEGCWVFEEKYDGIMCIAEVGIAEPRFWSRHDKMKAYDLPAFPVPAVLIGELAYGSQSAKTAVEMVGHGIMWVFDVLVCDGVRLDVYSTQFRRSVLENDLWNSLDSKLTEHYVLAEQTRSGFRAAYDRIIARKGEGGILKLMPGSAWLGERVDEWIKCKKEIFVDAVLVDVEISTSDAFKGLVKSLVIGQYDRTGKLVNIGHASGLTTEDRRRFLDKKLIGSVVEVKCNEVFKSGKLRHPEFVRLRDDKTPKECVLR